MKKYETPNVDVIAFTSADIITLSAPDVLAGNDDVVQAPGSWFKR